MTEIALIGAQLGLAGLQWDSRSGRVRDSMPERPERRYAGRILRHHLHRIVWAGRHAGAAAGTRFGDQQRAVPIPVDGIGWAGLNAFGADAALAAGIGYVQPVEHHAVQVDARLSV